MVSVPVLALAAAVLAVAALGPVAGSSFPNPVPCTDPRGCPDLVVDPTRFAIGFQGTQNFNPSSCSVQEGMIQPGQRQVLRFTFTTPNIGSGDLIVGKPADHPEWFVWHNCHQHYHFREYADYRLWTPSGWQQWDAYRQAHPELTAQQALDAQPALQSEFVAGNKMGFCVIDIAWGASPHGAAAPDVPKYFSCNAQGISVGWADEYWYSIDGQWVDVTGVPTGQYVLESEVNAERVYIEEDYANNRAALPVVVAEQL